MTKQYSVLELREMSDKVCKFGGSSLANAEQIRKVRRIIEEDPQRRFVVVSAPGKAHEDDAKVTDLLLLCHEKARRGRNIEATVRRIAQRFESIGAELGVDGISDWIAWLHELLLNYDFTRASRDWLASRGEYLMARLLAEHLDATFVDAADGIFLQADGRLDERKTYSTLARLLCGGASRDKQPTGKGRFVIPGFYGVDPSGGIKTFDRGGSDITGSIVARAVGAEVYENWTDVPGILMTDPRIVPGARPIRELTYGEMRELAYMGATALQHDTVFPVREADIPIHICNTNDPQAPGTWIRRHRDAGHTPQVVVGIAGKKGYSVIFIKKPMMTQERDHGLRVLSVLDRHGVRYEHSPSSIDSMSVIISDEELRGKERQLLKDLHVATRAETIEVMRDLAFIATVGLGMAHRHGVAARLFAALGKAGVNVRMINQGASEINIMIGVVNEEFEQAIRAIYRAFA